MRCHEGVMKEFRGRVTSGGRIAIPAALRREYGLTVGQEVVFRRGEMGLELLSPLQPHERGNDTRDKSILSDEVGLPAEFGAARKSDESLR